MRGVLFCGAWLLQVEAFTIENRVTRLSTSLHILEKPSFLTGITNPFSQLTGGGSQDSSAPNDNAFDSSINSQPYDGDTEAGLINQAKRVFQCDLGLTDPSLLDDTRFAWLGPTVDAPLSKTEYIAAGRFFNLRGAFPDLDYRPHDFRIDEVDGSTVRCTCRVTGTMRGELRLRNGVLPPTGVTMRCPPEAVSMTFDRSTGKLIKLCTGFCLDRLVGNTQGTTGVQAASTVAGESISAWDLFPPATVLGNIFARPAKPVPETTSFFAPFPETVMIQLAKGVIASDMGADDPSLLSDDFTYCTPIVGPIRKAEFLGKYASDELAAYDPNFTNFRIDPFDPVRVWVDLRPSGPNYEGPPQAMSFTFDEDGYCTRVTSSAVMDPSIGNSGGLGGPEGYKYATSQASPGFFTRPFPRALGRLRIRLSSPFTGVAVDEFKSVPGKAPVAIKGVAAPVAVSDRLEITTKTPAERIAPKTPIERVANAELLKEDNAVLKRLEILKEFTSSIRIIPPNFSRSISVNPLSDDRTKNQAEVQAERESQLAATKAQRAEKAKQQAAVLKQQQAAKARQQAEAKAEAEQERLAKAAALQLQRQAQQEALKRKQRESEQARAAEASRRQQVAQKAEADRQRKELEIQRAAETAKKQAEADRRKRVLETQRAEADRQKAAEVEQRALEAQAKRAAVTLAAEAKKAEAAAAAVARQAAIEERKREAELKRAAATSTAEARKMEAERLKAAVEAKKAQSAQDKLADQKRREEVAKAKLAEVAARAVERQKTGQKVVKPVKLVPSGQSEQEERLAFSGLAQAASRATVALFGLGKKELEELPTAKGSTSKKAPFGVPSVSRWRQNTDKTITGLVSGSRSFEDGSRITTSPITSGKISPGEVVRTGSGSRYFLE